MKSNQIKQAFESIQADSDLADRVIDAAAGEPLRRKGHAKPLYVAVIGCLAGVLATGGVAYAVINSSYFASAWGNHGNGDSITWTNGGSSGTKYTYTREFGDGIAPQSLEGAVQEVNLSVEGNGYTLDIHEMAIDQNGCGAVTFTLSNSNGVNYYKPAAETGELVLYGEEEQGIGTPSMNFGEEWADTRCTIDKDTSSDTVINGTMYFASWDRERDLGHASPGISAGLRAKARTRSCSKHRRPSLALERTSIQRNSAPMTRLSRSARFPSRRTSMIWAMKQLIIN